MKNEKIEIVCDSGNIYRDFGDENSNVKQARAIIAAQIIATLDEQKISTREAERIAGVSHADISRIRNTHLERFTLDRMINILEKLNNKVKKGD